MKKLFILFIATGVSTLVACTDNDVITREDQQGTYSVEAYLEPISANNEAYTRVEPTDKGDNHYSFSWQSKDKIAIYGQSTGSSGWGFFQLSGNGGDAAGVFSGIFKLTSGTSYYSFYPPHEFTSETKANKVLVDYTGQRQLFDSDMSHLRDYIYYAAAQGEDGRFKFKHVGALVRINIPDYNDCTEIEFTTTGPGSFITKGEIDLTSTTISAAPAVNAVETSSSFSLSYQPCNHHNYITAYAMIAPTDLSKNKILVTTKHTNGKDKMFSVTPQQFLAGKAYVLDAEPYIPYLTFHAESTQTVRMTESVETLQYSVNGGPWNTLGTNIVTFGGSLGDVQVRGNNYYGTFNSSFVFGNSTLVSCSGDIRTLVYSDGYDYYEDSNMAVFNDLFKDCKVLTSAPELPYKVLRYNNCYQRMFYNCSSLTVAPKLPATTLSGDCYKEMFYNCSSLTVAPELPATTLSNNCYEGMFYDCSSLTVAPELPATTLSEGCYKEMFTWCNSLTVAPELPATVLTEGCYNRMFNYCFNLDYVKIDAIDVSAPYCLDGMLESTASNGTIVKNKAAKWSTYSIIPEGWQVADKDGNIIDDTPYLTFCADDVQTLNLSAAISSFEYSVNGGVWKSLGTNVVIFGGVVGDLKIRGKSISGTRGFSFSFGNSVPVSCDGDIRTLVDYENYKNVDCGNATFECLFRNCTVLTSAPRLPSTNLADNCYEMMFKGCSSLREAPDLPAESLAAYCYQRMFEGCTSLISAPSLWAYELKSNCYFAMFSGCTSLSYAPHLTARTLVNECYSQMFNGCTNLKYVYMMATDISASNCLDNWLSGVSSSGTFHKNKYATWNVSGDSGIPSGWKVVTAF